MRYLEHDRVVVVINDSACNYCVPLYLPEAQRYPTEVMSVRPAVGGWIDGLWAYDGGRRIIPSRLKWGIFGSEFTAEKLASCAFLGTLRQAIVFPFSASNHYWHLATDCVGSLVVMPCSVVRESVIVGPARGWRQRVELLSMVGATCFELGEDSYVFVRRAFFLCPPVTAQWAPVEVVQRFREMVRHHFPAVGPAHRLLFHNRAATLPRHLWNAAEVVRRFRASGLPLALAGFWASYVTAAREMCSVRLLMGIHGAWFGNALLMRDGGVVVEVQSGFMWYSLRRLTRALPLLHIVDRIAWMPHFEVGYCVYPMGQVELLIRALRVVLRRREADCMDAVPTSK